MEADELSNPFDYSNAVTNPSLFAARHKQLSDASYLLSHLTCETASKYLAVYGARGTGKTSFANRVSGIAIDRNYLVSRSTLTSADAQPLNFFRKIYEDLLASVLSRTDVFLNDGQKLTSSQARRAMAGSPSRPDDPLQFPETLHHSASGAPLSEIAFRADLAYFSRLVATPIIVVIDEAQVIAGDEPTLSTLRVLGQNIRGFVFILSGTHDLLRSIGQVSDHILRQFTLIELDRFLFTEEVEECITRAISSIELAPYRIIEDLHGTADSIFRITDGNPHQVQLVCHVMFEHWQRSADPYIELSSAVLDNVRELLEAGDDLSERPALDTIRELECQQLISYNILTAASGHASFDECWFAYVLGGAATLTRDQLRADFEDLLARGLLQVEGGLIESSGDSYDRIYTRLWTIEQLRYQHIRFGLTSDNPYTAVLTRQLYSLIFHSLRPEWSILQACCLHMLSETLWAGIDAVTDLPRDVPYPRSATYLHNAMVESRSFKGLKIVEISCAIGESSGKRWIFTDLDNNADSPWLNSTFDNVNSVLRQLGGVVTFHDIRVTINNWDELMVWLESNAPAPALDAMSDLHVHAAFENYSRGSVTDAVRHLQSSRRLFDSWLAVNNLLYIAIADRTGLVSRDLETEALELAKYPGQKALTLYNCAIASMQRHDYPAAQAYLKECDRVIPKLLEDDLLHAFLVIPLMVGATVKFEQREDSNLRDAVRKSSRIIRPLLQSVSDDD